MEISTRKSTVILVSRTFLAVGIMFVSVYTNDTGIESELHSFGHIRINRNRLID